MNSPSQPTIFDFSGVDSESFNLLPEDTYPMKITGAEFVPTKKGGVRLAIKFEVVSGKFKGYRVFHSINTECENATARKIGHSELKKLLEAIILADKSVASIKTEKEVIAAILNMYVLVDVITEEQQGFSPANRAKGYRCYANAHKQSNDEIPF